jgi:hypothetical protein
MKQMMLTLTVFISTFVMLGTAQASVCPLAMQKRILLSDPARTPDSQNQASAPAPTGKTDNVNTGN